MVELSTSTNFDYSFVDGADLEAIVMRWDRVNLSLHPDFLSSRATIENMACVLRHRIAALGNWPMRITVFETSTVHAIYKTDDFYTD